MEYRSPFETMDLCLGWFNWPRDIKRILLAFRELKLHVYVKRQTRIDKSMENLKQASGEI